MKTLLLALALATAPVLSAQTLVQGPAYIARAQVVTVGQTSTLTSPTLSAFPVEAFLQTDLGTIDGDAQKVISSVSSATISFDMLDAQHAAKTVTWTFNGVSYTMSYAALVNGFGAAVAQETPPAPPK